MRRFHYILTLSISLNGSRTVSGIVTVAPGTRRDSLLAALQADALTRFGFRPDADCAVLFFSLDPLEVT